MNDEVIRKGLFHAKALLEDFARQDEPSLTWETMVEMWPVVYGPVDEALKRAEDCKALALQLTGTAPA